MSETVIRANPGDEIVVVAPAGEKVAHNYNAAKSRIRVRVSGTAPVPAPNPDPDPEPVPEPVPEPEPTPEPTPEPEPTPPTAGPGLVIAPADLAKLPTSGKAWDSLKATATGSWGTANLTDQNNKHGVAVLAGALVADRTKDSALRSKVIAAIESVMGTEKVGADNSILSLGRQLPAYVIAADVIGYRSAAFTSWLSAIRTKALGGHGRWGVLRGCSRDSSSNWGTHATAAMVCADAYLGDKTMLAEDWSVFKGYGDGSWKGFKPSSSSDPAFPCGDYVPIEPGSCQRHGVSINGAFIDDTSRDHTSKWPSSYIHESPQGHVVSAIVLARAGYPAWDVNDRQVLRNAEFANSVGRLNDSAVSLWIAHVINAVYKTNLPTKTPTSGGRSFGYTDWLY